MKSVCAVLASLCSLTCITDSHYPEQDGIGFILTEYKYIVKLQLSTNLYLYNKL